MVLIIRNESYLGYTLVLIKDDDAYQVRIVGETGVAMANSSRHVNADGAVHEAKRWVDAMAKPR